MKKENPGNLENNFKQSKSNENSDHHGDELIRASAEDMEAILKSRSDHFKQQPDGIFPEDAPLIAAIEAKLDRLDAQTASPKPILHVLRAGLEIAAILACLLTGILYLQRRDLTKQEVKATVSVIRPGSNQALLTLANGSTIILDSAKTGMLVKEGKVNIYKSRNGQLVYHSPSGATGADTQNGINTISTPRGGQYQVVLPDGSNVWLNAASSIKFPSHFSGKSREVLLEGEAYFEVAHNKAQPFIVTVNENRIQVYGTHFNVMGYAEEGITKTTLLEGSVKVIKGKDEQMLLPGQQACVGEGIKVSRVNAAEAIEWKNGNFKFSNEKLPVVMRKIARWYNVDIEYRGKVTNEVFVGTIPRSQSIQELLKYLELTNVVHFKIEERRIVVTQ